MALKQSANVAYRFAFGLAVAAGLILVWVNLAVGIIGEPDNPANLMYVGVLVVGAVGTIIARFQPQGMARAALATALAQTLVVVIVLTAGLGVPGKPGLGGILMMNGLFVVMWAGSALLFRKAAQEQMSLGA